MTVAADSEVAGYLTRWKPARGTSPAAAAFARFVVAAAGPGSQDRAKCLLWAACKLAGYGTGLGLEPRCAPTCGSWPARWCRTWTRRMRRCPASGPRLLTPLRRSPATWH
jgi:hypothetical protein